METHKTKDAEGGVLRKRLVVGGILAFLALGLGAVWVVYFSPKAGLQEEFNQYVDVINDLESQAPPTDPLQKAIYYGQLGQAYRDNKQPDKALQNYATAQDVIDQNKLGDQYVFYQALADTYKDVGNREKEKEYLAKQIKYLRDWQAANPGETGVEEGIKTLEDRLSKL